VTNKPSWPHPCMAAADRKSPRAESANGTFLETHGPGHSRRAHKGSWATVLAQRGRCVGVGPIEVTVVEWLGNGRKPRADSSIAPHKSAVLLALKARAVEESFPDLCVMAIADRGHHVTCSSRKDVGPDSSRRRTVGTHQTARTRTRAR